MDYAALHAEASLAEYDGLTPEQKAAAIRAKEVAHALDVPIGTVEGWCRARGLVTRLELFLRQPLPEMPDENDPDYAAKALAFQQGMQVYTAANEMIGMLRSSQVRVFEMSDPAMAANIEGMLTALVAAGIFDQEHAEGLLALSVQTTTRAAELGFPALNDQDILAAEKLYG